MRWAIVVVTIGVGGRSPFLRPPPAMIDQRSVLTYHSNTPTNPTAKVRGPLRLLGGRERGARLHLHHPHAYVFFVSPYSWQRPDHHNRHHAHVHTFHHNTHTPTGDPSPDWAWLHNRFPLVLPSKEAEAQWLDTDKFKAEELLPGLRAPVDIPGMVGRWVGCVLLCWLWWVRDVRPAAWTIPLSFCAPTRRDRCATPAPRK